MMMKKYMAPVIITILFSLFTLGFVLSFSFGLIAFKLWWILLILVPIWVYVLWLLVSMLKERLREIKEEDKDDLSKY